MLWHSSLTEFRTYFTVSRWLMQEWDSFNSKDRPIRWVDDADEFCEFTEFRTEHPIVGEGFQVGEEPDPEGPLEDLTAFIVSRMEPYILLAGGLTQNIPQIALGRDATMSAATYHGLAASLLQMIEGDPDRPLPLRRSQYSAFRLIRTGVMREMILLIGVAQERFPRTETNQVIDVTRVNGERKGVTASKLDLERLDFKKQHKGLGDKQLAKKFGEMKGKKCSARAFVQSCYRARLAGNSRVTKSHPLLNGVPNP